MTLFLSRPRAGPSRYERPVMLRPGWEPAFGLSHRCGPHSAAPGAAVQKPSSSRSGGVVITPLTSQHAGHACYCPPHTLSRPGSTHSTGKTEVLCLSLSDWGSQARSHIISQCPKGRRYQLARHWPLPPCSLSSGPRRETGRG